jgi:hypothetical protein
MTYLLARGPRGFDVSSNSNVMLREITKEFELFRSVELNLSRNMYCEHPQQTARPSTIKLHEDGNLT